MWTCPGGHAGAIWPREMYGDDWAGRIAEEAADEEPDIPEGPAPHAP